MTAADTAIGLDVVGVAAPKFVQILVLTLHGAAAAAAEPSRTSTRQRSLPSNIKAAASEMGDKVYGGGKRPYNARWRLPFPLLAGGRQRSKFAAHEP